MNRWQMRTVPILALSVVVLVTPLTARGGDVPFAEHVIWTEAGGAKSVYATDLDGDGDIDVLSASGGEDNIVWYENNGAPDFVFTRHVISTVASGAKSVYATNLDCDGDTDVLSASVGGNKIAWYENNGESPPEFTESGIPTEATNPVSVFATDLDCDGDTDVLAALHGNEKVMWYENDGGSPPTFTEREIPTTVDGPGSVYAADVNGDGCIDVLSASDGDDNIVWYKNDCEPNPIFTQQPAISTTADGANSVYATDVDGDGDIDVLSASSADDKIAWYENDGEPEPTFTERLISDTANFALSVFAADVDGDGDTDVLSASTDDDKIAWYENGGSPPWDEHIISDTADGANSVFAADVDGDGDIDVLSASFVDGKIAWYENLSPCGFDSDCDGDIDWHDFQAFDLAFTGPDP